MEFAFPEGRCHAASVLSGGLSDSCISGVAGAGGRPHLSAFAVCSNCHMRAYHLESLLKCTFQLQGGAYTLPFYQEADGSTPRYLVSPRLWATPSHDGVCFCAGGLPPRPHKAALRSRPAVLGNRQPKERPSAWDSGGWPKYQLPTLESVRVPTGGSSSHPWGSQIESAH